MAAALAAAAVLSQIQLPAQSLYSWQTVDDFQLVPGLLASGNTLGTATLVARNATAGTYTTKVTNLTATGLTWDGKTPPNSYTKTK